MNNRVFGTITITALMFLRVSGSLLSASNAVPSMPAEWPDGTVPSFTVGAGIENDDSDDDGDDDAVLAEDDQSDDEDGNSAPAILIDDDQEARDDEGT